MHSDVVWEIVDNNSLTSRTRCGLGNRRQKNSLTSRNSRGGKEYDTVSIVILILGGSPTGDLI